MNSIHVIDACVVLATPVDSDVLTHPQGVTPQCESGAERGHRDPVLPDLAWLVATCNRFSKPRRQRSG